MGGGGDQPLVRPEPAATCGDLGEGTCPRSARSHPSLTLLLSTYNTEQGPGFLGSWLLAGHSPHPCTSALALLLGPFPLPLPSVSTPTGEGLRRPPSPAELKFPPAFRGLAKPAPAPESVHRWVKDSGRKAQNGTHLLRATRPCWDFDPWWPLHAECQVLGHDLPVWGRLGKSRASAESREAEGEAEPGVSC